jgi:hypothetical protein
MRLGSKALREIRQIEEHGRSEESVARVRSESFLRHLAHLFFLCFAVAIADLLSRGARDHRLTPGA